MAVQATNKRKEYVFHHHHVPEGLGMFPVPWSSRWSWSLHLFLGRPMFLRPFKNMYLNFKNDMESIKFQENV